MLFALIPLSGMQVGHTGHAAQCPRQARRGGVGLAPVCRNCHRRRSRSPSLRDLTRVDEQAPGNVLSVDPGISDEQYASWFPGNEQGYSPFQNKNPDPGIE